MKTFTINNAKEATETGENEDKRKVQFEIHGDEDMEASDGYHTFGELYEHRIRLFIALSKMSTRNAHLHQRPSTVWCSTKHSDGSTFGDWFILGIGKKEKHQITYHLPARFWSEVCEFAEVLDKAPEWDKHSGDDVLERLKSHPDL